MESYIVALGSACWLGILTSISPCPLAANIAAVTYIGKRVDRPLLVLASGIIYTLGRTITYVALGVLVVSSILAIPGVAMFLQQYLNKVLGPVLLVAGLFLLNVIRLRLPGLGVGERLQRRVDRYGLWGAGLLGLLFALSFCPVSAALFFGSLIPLAVEQQSRLMIPSAYGIGTALPVVVFALVIALSARLVGAAFSKVTVFANWARRITGAIFMVVGGYYVLVYLMGVNVW